MPVFVGNRAMRERMRLTRARTVVAGTGLPPRLDAHDRTLQVYPSLHGSLNLPVRLVDKLRPFYTVNAPGPQ